MKHISIGYMRNLLKKRKEIIHAIRKIAEAEDTILLTQNKGSVYITGHTQSDAMTLYLLGTAAGMGYIAHRNSEGAATVEEYLAQPLTVARTYIERNS